MVAEGEIAQNLWDAGCGEKNVELILACLKKGDQKQAEHLIAQCRKMQLDRMHDSQACIDRLDYLSYRLKAQFSERRTR